MSRCFCPCHTSPGVYPPPCSVCGHDTREGRMVGTIRDGWEPNEPKRMTRQEWQTLKVQDFDRMEARVSELEAQNREYVSLLECTEFALDWLTLHHVIEKEGADWRSKFDGSSFYACDCSENGGYMEWDTNAYIHTERCASGFEDSLPALHDQIRRALGKV